MPKVETFDRNQILEKVVRLFHEKGYTATSMQDMVDVTGLNRSSIYNSFGSKLELYNESLKAYKAKMQQFIQKTLIRSTDPIETIRSIFISNEGIDKNGCLLSNCTTEMANQNKKIRSFLIRNRDYVQELFETLVLEGQNEGIINSNKTAKEYAIYLFAALQGVKITGMIVEEPKDIHSVVDTTLSVLY